MLKIRDKKTGAISFQRTADDTENYNIILRLDELEKKVKYLENLIIETKKKSKKTNEEK